MKSLTTPPLPVEPGEQLYLHVRSGFVARGTSLSRWCRDNGIDRVWATDALKGKRNGYRATELRRLLIDAAAERGRRDAA